MHIEGRHSSIMADFSHELLEPHNSGVRAFSSAAGVTVMDKSRLPSWLQVTDKEMMDNPIPEMGGKDLSGLGAFRDKAGGRKGAVSAGFQFLLQFDEVSLGVKLKLQGCPAAAFGAAAVQISPVKIFQNEKRSASSICPTAPAKPGRRGRRTGDPSPVCQH
ncbi:MAG: hypothetical protein FD159_2600 [Syntrophaceae bacterium]|nr:MAG: hypothetical protein FD159_2600 [Syntrophaceae bacterium]